MRYQGGSLAWSAAVMGGLVFGLCATNALAADGTVEFHQAYHNYTGTISGGEFGAYNFSNPSILAPIAVPPKVNTVIDGIGPFQFQTFCLESQVHIEFDTVLNYTVSTSVSLSGGGTRNLSAEAAYLYTKFWTDSSGTAFSPPYTYTLGDGRCASADDLQAAIWFVEGEWGNPFNTLPPNAQAYVLDAKTQTAAGGTWANIWGTTFPGYLGGVRALNLDLNGTLQQNVLVNIVQSPPPPDGNCTGFTPGFWHNRNGQKLIKNAGYAWLTVLREDYDLVRNNGNPFNPTSDAAGAAALADWLTSSTATNMAAKLSTQLAAMVLNVLSGNVDESCEVYTGASASCLPGSPSTITIGDLLDLAQAALHAPGGNYTPSGDPDRDYQKCLKNILDAANNNLNWVQ